MTYICHDTITTNGFGVKGWMTRIAGWFSLLSPQLAKDQIDPLNEHLMRDAGITDRPSRSAIGTIDRAADQLPYSMMGNNIRFADLFLAEHLDRGPKYR